MLYFFIFLVISTFFVLNSSVTSIGEFFNPELSKIHSKVERLISKGYNVNITYLYFKGTEKRHTEK